MDVAFRPRDLPFLHQTRFSASRRQRDQNSAISGKSAKSQFRVGDRALRRKRKNLRDSHPFRFLEWLPHPFVDALHLIDFYRPKFWRGLGLQDV